MIYPKEGLKTTIPCFITDKIHLTFDKVYCIVDHSYYRFTIAISDKRLISSLFP